MFLQPEGVRDWRRSAKPEAGVRAGLRMPVIPGLFVSTFLSYVVVGGLIVFLTGSIPIDTWARVGNAYYAIFSRDPHLAAIGFVLPPIPTIAIMPLLPFKFAWPALVTSAFAGPITSAAFMAGAVVLFRRTLNDLAVPRLAVALLVATFALHPMILYYGANGLTEAPFVFALMWAASSLLRWIDRGRLADLVRLGMALAVGYLTRYEFIAAAPAAVIVVGVITYLRTPGKRAERRSGAAADAIVVGVPFAIAFVLWAAASWILVGSPFAQFTSIYGNSSQVGILKAAVIAQTGQGTSAALVYVGTQILGLAPALPIIAILVALRAGWRLDARIAAAVAVIGAPLAFSVVAFLTGSTVGFLRYEIAAIPLTFVLAGMLIAGREPIETLPLPRLLAAVANSPHRVIAGAHRIVFGSATGWRARVMRAIAAPFPKGLPMGILATAVVLGSAVSIPTAVLTLRHPLLAREEAAALEPILGNDPAAVGPSYVLATHTESARVAAALDAMGLGRGTVLLDTATGNPIVLQSAHPEQFVITPDRDFAQILADPATFGVSYLVVSGTSGEGALDALNRAYPDLYDDGAGIATLVQSFDEPGAAGWRIYRVIPHQK